MSRTSRSTPTRTSPGPSQSSPQVPSPTLGNLLRRGRQLLVPRRYGNGHALKQPVEDSDDVAGSDDGHELVDSVPRSADGLMARSAVRGGGLAGVRALQQEKQDSPAVSVYAWGRGSEGQLMLAEADSPRGEAALADAGAPSIIPRLTQRSLHNSVVDLAGGMWSTTFAITMSGVVFASGSNEERELHPTIDTDAVAHPHIMATLDAHHVLQMAAGASHCAAITANRTVLTWGSSNSFGELGRGDRARAATAANTCTALPLYGLSRYRAVQVSCGMHFTLTLTARGVVSVLYVPLHFTRILLTI